MRILFISFCFLLLTAFPGYAQDSSQVRTGQLLFKPSVGAMPWSLPLKVSASVLLEYSLRERWVLASRSVLSHVLTRDSYDVHTHYSYILGQQFGGGYSFAGRRRWARYTFLLLGGVKHIAFKETMDHPGVAAMTIVSRTTMPDVGLLNEVSFGRKRMTFDVKAYLPFYPFEGYPISTYKHISFEMGVGMRL